MNRAFCLAITGGSGSGKTTLARELCRENGWSLFPIDCYYKDLTHLSEKERREADFDNPDAIEWPVLIADLDRLIGGESIDLPSYDYSNQKRTPAAEQLNPAAVVVIEGIFALAEPAVKQRCDYSIFVELPADLRLVRRLRRDVVDRKIPADLIIEQWVRIVRPAHYAFIEPTKDDADLVVFGAAPLNQTTKKISAILAAQIS